VTLINEALAVGREVGTAFGVGGWDEGRRDALPRDAVDVIGARRRAPDETERALIWQQARAVDPFGDLGVGRGTTGAGERGGDQGRRLGGRGLGRSGRTRDQFKVVAFLRVAINEDVDQATQDAKAGVPMYAQIAQYSSYFAAHGFADEAGALSSRPPAAPYRDLAGAITDEMAEFVIVWHAEEAAEQIADLLPYVDELASTAPTALPPDRTREYEAAIAQHLLPLGLR
jgi:hypothetical protein